MPLEAVIEFKREVYTQALNELSPILFRRGRDNRYLRQRPQPRHANRDVAVVQPPSKQELSSD